MGSYGWASITTEDYKTILTCTLPDEGPAVVAELKRANPRFEVSVDQLTPGVPSCREIRPKYIEFNSWLFLVAQFTERGWEPFGVTSTSLGRIGTLCFRYPCGED